MIYRGHISYLDLNFTFFILAVICFYCFFYWSFEPFVYFSVWLKKMSAAKPNLPSGADKTTCT